MNDERAEWVLKSLRTFADLTGQNIEDPIDHDELSDVVGDFLADLMHFCDRQDLIIFGERLANAREHYETETTPEPEPIDVLSQSTNIKTGN